MTAQTVYAFMAGLGLGMFIGMAVLRRACTQLQEQNLRLITTWTPKPETVEEAIAELRRQK